MRPNRGAVVLLLLIASAIWCVQAVLWRDIDRPPWELNALERRSEADPALSGVIEDRHGRVLVRPVYNGGRWVAERPYGRALADVGLGRTMIQPQGIQGNLAGLRRTGSKTLRPYEATSDGVRWLLGDPLLTAPAMPTLRISIDANLSAAIYKLLAKDRIKGAAVVLNARTREIWAIVDYPAPDVTSDIEPDSVTSLDAMAGVNLPASTMKLISAAYVLERRPSDATRSHVCSGDRCWTRHGVVRNLEDAVVRSCNTWFRFESAGWNRTDWLQFVLGSGLQSPDTPGLPIAPLVMVGHNGATVHWPHVVGQQVWVSLLNLAGAYATLTSEDGRRIAPLVLSGSSPDDPARVVRPPVAARLRAILWATGREGTARSVNQLYSRHNAGAKTGTGERDGRKSDAVFVALAPWHKPEWVVVVTQKGGGSGSRLGVVVGRILNLLAQPVG